MTIDNLTGTQLFVEKKTKITITCDSKKNNNGVLEVDDNDNKLISMIDSGDTKMHRLTSYKGSDYVLFYNENTKRTKMVQEGDIIDMALDFVKGTKYFVGAKKIYVEKPNKYKFSCDLTNLNIFKVFLDNGRELKNYRLENDGITIMGNDRMYVNKLSEIVIYTYVSNSTKVILGSKQNYSFVIEYFGYEAIFDLNQFMEGSYFDISMCEEITLFERLKLSESVIKDSTRRHFANAAQSRINSISNSLDMSTFVGDEAIDLPQYVGGDEFRLIAINPSFGRIVLINNCTIDEGVSLDYDKEKNSKEYNISCGNYIDINLSRPSLYGMRKYGRGYYGDGTMIHNSSRIGV